jgi:hypothetical protein
MEACNMRQASGGAKWGKPGEGPVQKYRINDKHRMCEVQQFVARLLTSFLTIRPPNNVASSEATSPKFSQLSTTRSIGRGFKLKVLPLLCAVLSSNQKAARERVKKICYRKTHIDDIGNSAETTLYIFSNRFRRELPDRFAMLIVLPRSGLVRSGPVHVGLSNKSGPVLDRTGPDRVDRWLKYPNLEK